MRQGHGGYKLSVNSRLFLEEMAQYFGVATLDPYEQLRAISLELDYAPPPSTDAPLDIYVLELYNRWRYDG